MGCKALIGPCQCPSYRPQKHSPPQWGMGVQAPPVCGRWVRARQGTPGVAGPGGDLWRAGQRGSCRALNPAVPPAKRMKGQRRGLVSNQRYLWSVWESNSWFWHELVEVGGGEDSGHRGYAKAPGPWTVEGTVGPWGRV